MSFSMSQAELFAWAAAFAVLPFSTWVFVWVALSFARMRPYVRPRPRARQFGEALREATWMLFTQPILPLFYFVGRRLAGGNGTPIVAVHGYGQNRINFLGVARACSRAGLGPVYGFNYPWYASAQSNAKRLARFCERVRRETGAERVDLVAHSWGGPIALEYLHDGGAEHARRLVTVASPHAGIVWRGPLIGASGAQLRRGSAFLVERATRAVPVPSLSIYSTHDNVVHPPTTSTLVQRGGQDHTVEHLSHLAILFDARVTARITDFLSAPDVNVDLGLKAA
jgi:triacylglycerol lipase